MAKATYTVIRRLGPLFTVISLFAKTSTLDMKDYDYSEVVGGDELEVEKGPFGFIERISHKSKSIKAAPWVVLRKLDQ